MNRRLQDWVDVLDILYNTQAGFRKSYSTFDNIFVLQNIIFKSRFEKKKLFCAFIDFRKAFNSVFRYGLWYKLIQYNCSGKFLKVVKDMYDKLKCCVKTNEGMTRFFQSHVGVQQGAIMSPLLFALYLNDLNDALHDQDGVNIEGNYVKILLYADDIVLFSNTKIGLQNHLDNLYDYCTRWKLNVNLSKTKVLVCRGGGPISKDEFWFWGDQLIDICSKYKYLGIYFSANGITQQSLDYLADQAGLAILSLKYRLKNLGDVPLDLSLKLFHQCIFPILLYGSQVWGFRNCKVLERKCMRYFKFILRVSITTCNSAVYAELGEIPIQTYAKFYMIKYFLKIRALQSDRLDVLVLNYLCKNIDSNVYGICNLAFEVRKELDEIGLSYIFQMDPASVSEELINDIWVRQTDIAKAKILA